ncbi:MAG: phosphoribosylformylglycinamidine synthase subunit PurQ [Planctomycetota bacterium]
MTPPDAPQALLIRTAGTNCDLELAHGLSLAGAAPTTLHIQQLLDRPECLDGFDLIALPGGFSHGDDIAAGRVFAVRLQSLLDPLRRAIDRGVPILGVCNGFQVLVKLGLLPDPAAQAQQTTLTHNATGRFIDKWVGVEAPGDTVCVWTKPLAVQGRFELPIAHGEGRFVAEDDVLQRLCAQGQAALRYAPGENPNGSAGDLAGVCDSTGRVFGLMPHPERATDFTHHPAWTRMTPAERNREPLGLRMLRCGVASAASAASPAAGV